MCTGVVPSSALEKVLCKTFFLRGPAKEKPSTVISPTTGCCHVRLASFMLLGASPLRHKRLKPGACHCGHLFIYVDGGAVGGGGDGAKRGGCCCCCGAISFQLMRVKNAAFPSQFPTSSYHHQKVPNSSVAERHTLTAGVPRFNSGWGFRAAHRERKVFVTAALSVFFSGVLFT
jgi:hypothetical protein